MKVVGSSAVRCLEYSSGWKNKAAFQCLKGSGHNSSVWRDKVRIKVIGINWKDKVTIPKFDQVKINILMIVWKHEPRIPMFGRTRSKF